MVIFEMFFFIFAIGVVIAFSDYEITLSVGRVDDGSFL